MDVEEIKIYKIKRFSDGLFSNGLSRPSFNRKGKFWTQIGHLKNHLANQSKRQWSYQGCRIVAYKGIVDTKETELVSNVIEDYAKNSVVKKLTGLNKNV